ncbi:MAG: anaerobic carbon-monoxide dehydrogenase catalytic subunit [Candidatus Methanoperedens sp.]|nr:anaerobic carbon-monoxide dehydrogenase catalytic subunit [Candidatus Methanoperedens sp.]
MADKDRIVEQKPSKIEEVEPFSGQLTAKGANETIRLLDYETAEMIRHAESLGIDTVFQRQSKFNGSSICIEKRCVFGTLGLCCKQCAMGPCRIRQDDLTKPYKINKGTCGAGAETIAARNFLMMVGRGTAAHASHAKHVAQMLLKTAQRRTPYTIKDPGKLKAISSKIKLNGEKSIEGIANNVSQSALSDILGNEEYMRFAISYCPIDRDLFNLGVVPKSVGHELLEEGHETSMGTMADPSSLILHAARLGLADIASLIISSELQDVVFGAPKPVSSKIGISVLEEKKVNVVIHGHIQMLSEKIIELSEEKEFVDRAKRLGAEGINIVGCCCSGNDMLVRHGIPLAGGNLEQELIIATGLVEAFVMDVQCIFPNVQNVAWRFHTKLISTMKEGRFARAVHIPFEEEFADEIARKILDMAIENFPNRDRNTFLPGSEPRELIAGFSVEALLESLSRLDPDDPMRPLIDNMASGNIYGIVLLCGCTSPKVTANHAAIAKELLAHNVLVVATGCAAQACARSGLLAADAAEKYAGARLKKVLRVLGEASGIDGPLPPVWHFGSCVDNSRVIILISALAEKLGVRIKDLPVAASAAEWVTEKATAIGMGAVALGITLHLGVAPPVMGSREVVALLTEKTQELFGGKFIVELDPSRASRLLLEHIEKARGRLGMAAEAIPVRS